MWHSSRSNSQYTTSSFQPCRGPHLGSPLLPQGSSNSNNDDDDDDRDCFLYTARSADQLPYHSRVFLSSASQTPRMNLAALPHDVLLEIFEHCNAASLLNLELVCKGFHCYIALYESTFRKRLSKKYVRGVYDVGFFLFQRYKAPAYRPFLLSCAHLDVMIDLAVYKQTWPEHARCSHFCDKELGTELVRSLEHGLKVYQQHAVKANDPKSYTSKLKPRLGSSDPWARSSAEPEPIHMFCKAIHEKSVQRLSSVAVFDFELLYQMVLYGHAIGLRSRCFGICQDARQTGLTSRTKVRQTVAELEHANISLPTATRLQSHNPVVRRIGPLSESFQKIFRLKDEARPSLAWQEYLQIPLAIRIEALPIAHDAEVKTPSDHFKLAREMHRYFEMERPVEVKQARLISERAGYLDLNPRGQDVYDPCAC